MQSSESTFPAILMLEQYWTILLAVLPVFLVVAIGFAAYRVGWISSEAEHGLFKLTINVFFPCLIFKAVAWNPALREPGNVVMPPLIGFVTIAGGIAISYWVSRWFRKERVPNGTFALSAGMYNYGYIALPLALLLFDEKTVGVLFVHNVGVEAAMWSIGVWVVSGASLQDSWKRMLNMPFFAIVLGLTMNFSGTENLVPDWLVYGLDLLANCAIPFGLILVGVTAASFIKQFSVGRDKRYMLVGVLLRNGLLPALMLCIPAFFQLSRELTAVVVLQSAMSSAVIPIVLAKHYGGEPLTALRVVFASSTVGIVTIPLWLLAGIQIYGL